MFQSLITIAAQLLRQIFKTARIFS